MKRLITLIFLVGLLLMAGCIKEVPEITKTEALEINVLINPNEEGFRAVIGVDTERLEIENIIGYGLVYYHKEEPSLDTLVIGEDTNSVETDANEETYYPFFFHNLSQEDYSLIYHFRAYIKYGENETPSILYADEIVTTSLYELAKLDLSTFSREVVGYVEGDLIEEVALTVDAQNCQATALGEGYQVAITTDYNYITVTVTLEEEKFFASDVKLVVNDTELSSQVWIKNETTITYRFDDPNWTNPY